MDEHGAVYREVRASYFPNKAALPAPVGVRRADGALDRRPVGRSITSD